MAAWKRVVQLGLTSLQNFTASKMSGSPSVFSVNRFDYRHMSEFTNTSSAKQLNFTASKVSAIPSMKSGSQSVFSVNRFDYRHMSEFTNTSSAKQLSSGKVSCNLFEKRNIRDHKRRLLAEKYEVQRKLHKALCYDPTLPVAVRETHRHKLSKLPRNSAFSRLRNRCIFTGRPRAVYSFFRTSRIVFRKLAREGSLVGIKKSSW